MKKHSIYILLILLPALLSCDKFFGEKTDLGFIDVPTYQSREAAYVPIQPTISNVDRPIDIIIGFDELIYVVDEATEQIISYDEALNELGRFYVKGVTSVTQTRDFNLLAIGKKDTVINGTNYSLSTIYRINMAGSNGYGLNNASIIKKITHPFYFKSSFSTTDAQVTFNDIGILGSNNPSLNNRYYVTRSGPSANNAGQGPDDAVILFNNADKYIAPIAVNTSSGLYNDYFKKPFGLTSLCQPPQINASTSSDFMFTSLDPATSLSVQYIQFVETEFGAEFVPQIYAQDPIADSWLNAPNKFEQPMGITVAGDQNRYIFVTDATKDSVYQFTSNGLEGVPPPPASGAVRYVKVSFGGTGVGPAQFNEPRGVAFYKNILYVCDAGNHRVSRFKLTLDFE